jgi:GT2 family glycosyltransferase
MNDQAAPTPGGAQREVTLSIVVPTRNRVQRLGPLLDRLLAEPAAREVVVVDDGSTDGTRQLLDARAAGDPRLVVLQGPAQGPLQARVTGTEHARGDVVLLLDDDVMPDPGLAEGHLRHHRTTGDLLVLGYMPTRLPDHDDADTFTTRLYAAEYEGRCKTFDDDPGLVLKHLWMGNMSLPRERFLDVTIRTDAPLPPFRHEDQEIGLRLTALGMTAVFDRSLHGVHEHRRTLPQFRRDCRLDGAGTALLDRDHPGLYGEPGTGRFHTGVPRPLATAISVTSRPLAYRTVAGALAAGVRFTGAFGAAGPQLAAARLLRRVELQRGYLLQATGSGDPRA